MYGDLRNERNGKHTLKWQTRCCTQRKLTVRVQTQQGFQSKSNELSFRGICRAQSDICTGFSMKASALPWHYFLRHCSVFTFPSSITETIKFYQLTASFNETFLSLSLSLSLALSLSNFQLFVFFLRERKCNGPALRSSYFQSCLKILSLKCTFLSHINPLTPNDSYSGRTAPLTSKRFILYIYSTNIGTEYFKHGIYSPFFLFKMQFVS